MGIEGGTIPFLAFPECTVLALELFGLFAVVMFLFGFFSAYSLLRSTARLRPFSLSLFVSPFSLSFPCFSQISPVRSQGTQKGILGEVWHARGVGLTVAGYFF